MHDTSVKISVGGYFANKLPQNIIVHLSVLITYSLNGISSVGDATNPGLNDHKV